MVFYTYQVSSVQLRDDLLSMLVAGHETTGSVLTWTLYLLSKVSILLHVSIYIFFASLLLFFLKLVILILLLELKPAFLAADVDCKIEKGNFNFYIFSYLKSFTFFAH